MSSRDDGRLVDYLSGELSEREADAFRRALEADPDEAAEVASLGAALGTLRALEAEEPPAHLDALILATARQTAAAAAEADGGRGLLARLGRLLAAPYAGLAVGGALAVVVAVVAVPVGLLHEPARAPTSAAPASSAREASPADVAAPGALAQADAVRAEAALAEAAHAQAVADTGAARARAAAQAVALGEIEGSGRPPAAAERREAKEEAVPTQDAEPAPARRTARAPASSAVRPAAAAERVVSDEARALAPRGAPAAAGQGGGADLGEAKSKRARAEAEAEAGGAVAARGGDGLGGDLGARAAKLGSAPAPAEVEEPAAFAARAAAEDSSRPSVNKAATGASGPTPAPGVLAFASARLEAGDRAGAKAALRSGLASTRGTPAFGAVALRLAELEQADGEWAEAIGHAKAAADTRGFDRRLAAVELVRAVAAARNLQAELAWAAQARARIAAEPAL